MMTDLDRIIDYMLSHKGITVTECRDKIGTTELRKRVCDLKSRGYIIEGIWEKGVNRVGNKTRFKRYYLIGRRS